MIDTNQGYSYNDLRIVPAEISNISSRSECNCFLDNGNLPIFTAPMSTIVNSQNLKIWENNKLIPIIPRNIDYITRWEYLQQEYWVALSLNEFKEYFILSYQQDQINIPEPNKVYKVCVDLANGHMKSLYETINLAKSIASEHNYKLIIMTGNIANPYTYDWICRNADVDYIRLSIGTGNNCITSSNVGIHYPIASLIDECYQIKKDIVRTPRYIKETEGVETPYVNIPKGQPYKSCPAIIADGGIRNYDDVIKALALGADYVMIGSVFTAALESAGDMGIEAYNSHYKYTCTNGSINDGIQNVINVWQHNGEIDFEQCKRDFIKEMKSIVKESYGMSTKKAQKLINPGAKTKTSEGCTKYIPVKYTVNQWVENMESYLRSAMSYCNSKTLKDFIGKQQLKVQSAGAQYSVNK